MTGFGGYALLVDISPTWWPLSLSGWVRFVGSSFTNLVTSFANSMTSFILWVDTLGDGPWWIHFVGSPSLTQWPLPFSGWIHSWWLALVDMLCWILLHKLGDPVYSLGGYAWCLWICFVGSSIINLIISFTKLVTPFTIRVMLSVSGLGGYFLSVATSLMWWPLSFSGWVRFVGSWFTNLATSFTDLATSFTNLMTSFSKLVTPFAVWVDTLGMSSTSWWMRSS